MLSLLISLSRSLPEITDGVYFDITFQKKKLGRIELGICGKACPATLKTIIQGCQCTDTSFCYKGTNITDFTAGSHFVIGSSFSSKNFGDDTKNGPNASPYLVLGGNNGQSSGKLTVTLGANHEGEKSANPVGRFLSGQKVLQKINQISGKEDDDYERPEVTISACGLIDVSDNSDLDL